MNTAVILLFSKKWVPGLTAEDNITTLILVTGYGHVTPKTQAGRIVTILCALIGIPLTLLTVSNLGSIMATTLRFIYKSVCCGICCYCHRKPDRKALYNADSGYPGANKGLSTDLTGSSQKKSSVMVTWQHGHLTGAENKNSVSVPITLSVLLIAGYVIFGAVLFLLWE